MKKISLTSLFLLIIILSNAQSFDDYSFKIFRGKIAGADINLRLNSDSTYQIHIVKFWCSLCDMDSMAQAVYQSGTYLTSRDKIELFPVNIDSTFYIELIDDNTLRPQFSLDRRTYNIKDESIKQKVLTNTINNELYDFHLLYETYNNGILKSAKYIEENRIEYIIDFDESGEVRKIIKRRIPLKERKY